MAKSRGINPTFPISFQFLKETIDHVFKICQIGVLDKKVCGLVRDVVLLQFYFPGTRFSAHAFEIPHKACKTLVPHLC